MSCLNSSRLRARRSRLAKNRSRLGWLRAFALVAPVLFAAAVGAAPDPLDPLVVSAPKAQGRAEEGGATSVDSRTGSASYMAVRKYAEKPNNFDHGGWSGRSEA